MNEQMKDGIFIRAILFHYNGCSLGTMLSEGNHSQNTTYSDFICMTCPEWANLHREKTKLVDDAGLRGSECHLTASRHGMSFGNHENILVLLLLVVKSYEHAKRGKLYSMQIIPQ